MSPCITDGAPPNHLTKPLALLDDRHKGMLTAPTLRDPACLGPGPAAPYDGGQFVPSKNSNIRSSWRTQGNGE
jgi:hypothetical protein